MLRVVVSDRLERLADGLADEFRRSPRPDPFAKETVVVQNRGMERWLSMRLALELGIWALGEHPFPKAFLWRIARDLRLVPEPDPYEPSTVAWALMDILPACAGEPEDYLRDDPDGRKRVHLATSLADRFDQYAVYRADVLAEWERGAQPDDWQAHAWRALVRRFGPRHPARVLADLVAALAGANAPPPGLPPRIAVFGVSALPPRYLDAFAALALHVDVTFHAVNPCREMWFEIASPRAAGRLRARERRAGLPEGSLHIEDGPPLLAVDGAVARDFLGRLYDAAGCDADERFGPPEPAEGAGALRRLQTDLLEFRLPPSDPAARATLAAEDDSLQVHVAHSPLREIEVLHDRLLAMFEARPGLTPREVAVMAPDIELYAAHIESVFGSAEPRIPFSVADRSPVRTGHVAEVVRRLLRLPDGPAGASELLDLLACPPVMRRFGLDERALETLRDGVIEAGIRRGVGGGPHTWGFGLDRLVLGSAVDAGPMDLFDGVLPVAARDADLLEALCGFVAAVESCAAALRGPLAPAAWGAALQREAERFIEAGRDDAEEWRAIREAFKTPGGDAALAGWKGSLSLPALRDVLEGALDRSALASPFLAGGVTFCNLVPMRSIPFRVLCLIGMNDDAFPRQDLSPGFDLLRVRPRPGDRSRRMDDRHLFLECLTAAREVLYISHVGRDIRTDEPRPPSVCVSELLDVADRTFVASAPSAGAARDVLTVRHPLQPFSPDYFGGADSRLFSYSARHARGGRAIAAGSAPAPRATLAGGGGPTIVSLDDLVRFFRNPAEGLARVRFGVRMPRPGDAPGDDEPLLPGDAEDAAWLEPVVEARLEDAALPPVADLLRAAGAIPAGPGGDAVAAEFEMRASALAARAKAVVAGGGLRPVEWTRTRGEITLNVRIEDARSGGLLIWKAGKLWPEDRIGAWIRHLALNAAAPAACDLRTVVIGEDAKAIVEFAPVARAAVLLDDWLEAFASGLRDVLPFWPACAWEVVRPRRTPGNWDHDVRRAWSNDEGTGVRDRSLLLQSLYAPDEEDAAVGPGFEAWARRLLEPMLAASAGEGGA